MRNDFSRTPMYLALGLAIALVIGVLVGAKVVMEHSRAPVSLAALPAPQAESPECTALLAALPNSVTGLERAQLADPAPAGAAAWSGNGRQITLRCGIDPTSQYTIYSQVSEVAGSQWLEVRDPDSAMATWYTLNRSPVVAVTTDDISAGNPTEALADAIATLATAVQEPVVPLAGLATPEAANCTDLMAHLPEELGSATEPYRLIEVEGSRAAWAAAGFDPIVIVCGVEMPADYRAGERIINVNSINWFNGQDASYALGRNVIVAASLPQTSESAVVDISNLVAAYTVDQSGE